MADTTQPLSSPFQFYRLTNTVDQWKPGYLATSAIQKIVRVVTLLFDAVLTPFYFACGLYNLLAFTHAVATETNALKNRAEAALPAYLTQDAFDQRIAAAIAKISVSSSEKGEVSGSSSLPAYLEEAALKQQINDAIREAETLASKYEKSSELNPLPSHLTVEALDERIDRAIAEAPVPSHGGGSSASTPTLSTVDETITAALEPIQADLVALKGESKVWDQKVESLQKHIDNMVALRTQAHKDLEGRVAGLEDGKKALREELLGGLKQQIEEFHGNLRSLEETANELYQAIGMPLPYSEGESELSEEDSKKAILAKLEVLEKSLEAFKQSGVVEKTQTVEERIQVLTGLIDTLPLKEDIVSQEALEKVKKEGIEAQKKLATKLQSLEENLQLLNTGVLAMQRSLGEEGSSFTESESSIVEEKPKTNEKAEAPDPKLPDLSPIPRVLVNDAPTESALLAGVEANSLPLERAPVNNPSEQTATNGEAVSVEKK